MDKLNLPSYKITIKIINNKTHVFDIIRKKYVSLTPEENVRQHFIHYLIHEKEYPPGLIKVEKEIKTKFISGRGDIVVFDRNGEPFLIVECKAPEVKISQKSFDQIARYCIKLKAHYVVATNGMEHYCCKLDFEQHKITYLKEIPAFNK